MSHPIICIQTLAICTLWIPRNLSVKGGWRPALLPHCLSATGTVLTACAVMQAKREAVIAVYEAKPLISDHKVTEGMGPLHDVS